MSETRARLVWAHADSVARLDRTPDGNWYEAAAIHAPRLFDDSAPYLLLPVTFDEDGEPVVHGFHEDEALRHWSSIEADAHFLTGIQMLARQAKEV